jgi:hypothetical protein
VSLSCPGGSAGRRPQSAGTVQLTFFGAHMLSMKRSDGDFMKPLVEVPPVPAAPITSASPTGTPTARKRPAELRKPEAPDPIPADLPMPPKRKVAARVPLNTDIPTDLFERLDIFVHDNEATK